MPSDLPAPQGAGIEGAACRLQTPFSAVSCVQPNGRCWWGWKFRRRRETRVFLSSLPLAACPAASPSRLQFQHCHTSPWYLPSSPPLSQPRRGGPSLCSWTSIVPGWFWTSPPPGEPISCIISPLLSQLTFGWCVAISKPSDNILWGGTAPSPTGHGCSLQYCPWLGSAHCQLFPALISATSFVCGLNVRLEGETTSWKTAHPAHPCFAKGQLLNADQNAPGGDQDELAQWTLVH